MEYTRKAHDLKDLYEQRATARQRLAAIQETMKAAAPGSDSRKAHKREYSQVLAELTRLKAEIALMERDVAHERRISNLGHVLDGGMSVTGALRAVLDRVAIMEEIYRFACQYVDDPSEDNFTQLQRRINNARGET